MEFKELKEEILRLAKEEDACVDGYKEGLQAQNKSDLLKAITNNWVWAMTITGIIDAGFLEENFTEQELNDAHIYTRGYHEIRDSTAFACDSSTVTACDSSKVEAYDESYIEDRTGNLVPAGGNAIVKDCHENKIYIKKGTFKIVEIS